VNEAHWQKECIAKIELALRILHETEMSSGTQTNVMNDSQQ
jgi:hypothetical protein